MSGNLIEFVKLYEGTSTSSGKRYYRGRIGGLKVVGFPVETKGEIDAHIQLYVDGAGDKQQAIGATRTGSYGASSASGQHRNTATAQHAIDARKRANAERRANEPPPFDDALPFGGE